MAETTTTELSIENLGLEIVQGVGKASGKPYKALRLVVPVDGELHQALVFVNKIKK